MSPLPLRLKAPRAIRLLFVLLLLSCVAGYARAQQDYVGRYDIYNGYANLLAPKLDLTTRGYHLQAGWNQKTWLAEGFDYSVTTGHTELTPDLLPTALQQQLGQQILQLIQAGVIPPTYQVYVPVDSTTQTFAAGPQFNYRRFRRITLFIRPSLGAVHETATPHPHDQVTTVIAQELVPSGQKHDWTGFYGFGGGYDLNATKHIAIRMQTDIVYFHIFNDLLKDGRWDFRWSVGPTFHFGGNIRPFKSVLRKDTSSMPPSPGVQSSSSQSNP
ncbi:MAG TPA: hypothetical protein VGM02_06820 [Acidobacteriaceae bacterium]|jgi:hypothetical protein